ncbi:putative Kelch-like protein 32 [Hypsibius exemplaris]|uniref:Kelch-like protein 32 n=1 Tax=Hypsibius exemplaris TaxID=2072580 RepID=A0A1W0XF77_HYPEX|nr:putative Kelch-like protein 32 [Hypsibius exemplaris]
MEVQTWTKTYTTRTLQQLQNLRRDCKWTDIILQTVDGKEKFPAHRCVLASASPYFGAMLGSGMFAEAGKDIITIGDVTDDGLRLLLGFIYSGDVTLTSDKISEVLSAATLTQVNELVDLCEQVLQERMNPDNVVDIWTYSTNFSLSFLQSSVLRFVGKHLPTIDRKVLLRFDGDFIKRLLQEAVIPTVESSVLVNTVQWLDFNWKCREKYAKDLLRRIYWDRIHLRDQRAISVRCSKPLRTLLTEASKQPSPVLPRGMTASIVILGGFSIDGPINTLRVAPVGSNGPERKRIKSPADWSTYCRLPSRVRTVDFAVCALPDGGLLLCGGTFFDEAGNEIQTASTFVLDVHSSRWIQAGPMKKPRSGAVAVWFRNFIYVFGGDQEGQATCERYNICSNSWEFLGAARSSIEGAAVTVFGARIILSGGLDEMDAPSKAFHSYDPENNIWTALPFLPAAYSDHSMFAYDKKVFVLGGWALDGKVDLHTVHTDVYAYTADAGWQKEAWQVRDAKPFQRCVLADGKVYLIGGGCLKASQRFLNNPVKDTSGTVLKWYDLSAGRWDSCEERGVESAFWDHKAVMGYLPSRDISKRAN